MFVLDKENNEDIKELTENREEEKKLVKSRRMYACQLGCMDFSFFVKDYKILLQFLYNLLTAIIVNFSITWVRKLFYKSRHVWPVIIIVYFSLV